jgi:enterochelin esterase-like enzyme
MKSRTVLLTLFLLLPPRPLEAQNEPKPPAGTVERIKVHGKSLEGNLEGDSPDRDVCVYLPPSYSTARTRRYPVIYLLHGFTDSTDNWWGFKPNFISVPVVVNQALAAGGVREMIVVMPNAFTRYQGSMYSNSATVGDWETFVAKELVAYIDAHYRTIARRESRGLSGHSMGGYGTVRLGMKYPEVFSSIYALSPCCMAPELSPAPSWPAAEKIQTPDEVAQAEFKTKAVLAKAAAWSPNPNKPPFFFDLPSRNGELRPGIASKWSANAPLAMIDQYVDRLKQLRAIAFDAGAQDTAIAETVKVLDQVLTGYHLDHTFEIYEGTHTSKIAERMRTNVLPFFSRNLTF